MKASQSPVTSSFDPQRSWRARVRKVADMARRFTAIALSVALLAAGLGFDAKDPVEKRVPADCAYGKDLSVVVVAIDGVRYQDIFTGADPVRWDAAGGKGAPPTAEQLTPHIHALARRGVALGAPGKGMVSASGPNFVSLPGYAEILQGRPPSCYENDCNDPPSFTLMDGFAERYPSEKVASFASWTNIERVASSTRSRTIVSAGRVGGATRDALSFDPSLEEMLDAAAIAPVGVLDGDYRSDEHTAALALSYFERQTPRFMFVSLGDTDEYAHHDQYLGYLESLRRADEFIGELMVAAEDARAEGVETAIFVTTDHGRANDFASHGSQHPESARTWIVAGGGPIPALGEIASPEPRFLRDIAPTIAAMAGVRIEIAATTGQVMTELLPSCVPQQAADPEAIKGSIESDPDAIRPATTSR